MDTYTETQRFDQWWVRVLLVVILLLAASPLLLEPNFDLSSTELISVIISILLILIVFVGFWFLFKLNIRIDKKGITYRFVPFHMKPRFRPWEDIKSVTVRKYHPIKEFGGWGYRISLKGKKALNIKGNMGIQIVFENNDEILLGTQNPSQVIEVLKQYDSKI